MSAIAEQGQPGWLRRAALALGMVGLLVLGLHAGADRFDDVTFFALNVLDRLLDAVAVAVIERAGAWAGASPAWIEGAAFRAAALLDMDAKLFAARWLALFLELGADLWLALAVLDPRLARPSRAELLRLAVKGLRDPTGLRWSAPLLTLAASVAGAALVGRELQVLIDGGSSVLPPGLAAALSRGAGLLAFFSTLGLLGGRAVALGVARGERRAVIDRAFGRGAVRIRTRGLWLFVLALPLSFVALTEARSVLLGLWG